MATINKIKNTRRNIIFGLFSKIICLICPFLIKTVIIWQLGIEYVGLSSLFTSILQVLSLAEVGFGSAIVFSMYKPIAEDNVNKINRLLSFYRNIYLIIGLIITFIGVSMAPFLPLFISGNYPSDVNLYLLYFIYLLNTVSSYFLFGYRESLLLAHQRNDVDSILTTLFNVFMYIAQLFALIFYKNYYIYIIFLPITTILLNISRFFVTKKMYPFLICNGKLEKPEKKELYKIVFGLMLTRICQVTRNSLDSIVISMFLGLTILGQYQSYYFVMATVIGFVSIITTSVTAAIGNSVATKTKEDNYQEFKTFVFVYGWITSWCSICMLCLYQPFMLLWVGKENTLPFILVILMCIYFCSLKIGDNVSIYKDATGLYWQDRFRPIVESLANLFLNVVLVYYFGVYGVVISTIISVLFINVPWSAHIVFKNYFKRSPAQYYKTLFKNTIVLLIVSSITFCLCSFVSVNQNPFLDLIIKFLICLALPNIIYLVIFFKSPNFKKACSIFKKMFGFKKMYRGV